MKPIKNAVGFAAEGNQLVDLISGCGWVGSSSAGIGLVAQGSGPEIFTFPGVDVGKNVTFGWGVFVLTIIG